MIKNLRRFICACLAALTISGSALALEKDSPYTSNNKPALIDIFKDNFSYGEYIEGYFRADSIINHEYKYSDKDGKNFRYYDSLEPVIDGFYRTEDFEMLPDYMYQEGEVCDIEEEHAHLYQYAENGLFRPIYSEANEIKDSEGKVVAKKTKMIVKVSREACDILDKYQLFRAIDNTKLIYFFVKLVELRDMKDFKLILLDPVDLSGDTITLKPTYIPLYDEENNKYLMISYDTEAYNGFLIDGNSFVEGKLTLDDSFVTRKDTTVYPDLENDILKIRGK